MSRFRVPWKEVALAAVSLALFFGLLEALLAIVGLEPVTRSEDPFVGVSSRAPLFVPDSEAEAEDILVTAPGKRNLFHEQRFRREKPPGTYRIFCLGGSTTYGRPYGDATSFAGWLRELLPAADPSREWEVTNAGGISYASYRVAALMEELADYGPDLFIVYTGQNEFLEERTYGKLRDLPEAVRIATDRLSGTRTWAAMSKLLRRSEPSGAQDADSRYLLPAQVAAKLDQSAGLDLYERDDQLTEQIVRHYRVSLERMVETARRAGAELLFVTPASNLRSFSPFKSQPTDGLAEADRNLSETLRGSAGQLAREARWEEALAAIDESLAIDPRFADSHYARGRILFALGRFDEAKAAFERALDEDVCPLRALSPIETALRDVARETGTPLVDFVSLLEDRVAEEAGHSIPGDESFLDHVHPTIEAHRLLALALLETMTEEGITQPNPAWGKQAVQEVTRRVEGSIDPAVHGRALAQLAWTLDWAGKQEDSRRLAFRALEYGEEDPTILLIVARHEAFAGNLEAARGYFVRAVKADPLSPTVHYQYGLFLADRRELEAAAAHFFRASVLWPQDSRAHLKFGLVMAERGRLDIALPSLLEAERLNPGNPEASTRVDQVRQILGPAANDAVRLETTVTPYPSGAPRVIAQVKRDARGAEQNHGAWTEWTEQGELLRFTDYADGSPLP